MQLVFRWIDVIQINSRYTPNTTIFDGTFIDVVRSIIFQSINYYFQVPLYILYSFQTNEDQGTADARKINACRELDILRKLKVPSWIS